MYVHQIWHSYRGRWRNHLWDIFRWSVEGCRFCRGLKIGISHWLSQSPLTLGWRYHAARDNSNFNWCLSQGQYPTLAPCRGYSGSTRIIPVISRRIVRHNEYSSNTTNLKKWEWGLGRGLHICHVSLSDIYILDLHNIYVTLFISSIYPKSTVDIYSLGDSTIHRVRKKVPLYFSL